VNRPTALQHARQPRSAHAMAARCLQRDACGMRVLPVTVTLRLSSSRSPRCAACFCLLHDFSEKCHSLTCKLQLQIGAVCSRRQVSAEEWTQTPTGIRFQKCSGHIGRWSVEQALGLTFLFVAWVA
jgi:hypothetical protein